MGRSLLTAWDTLSYARRTSALTILMLQYIQSLLPRLFF